MNVRDAESSYLEGKALVEDWKGKFLEEWYRPQADLMIVQLWVNLPPAVKAQLKMRNPEAFGNAERQVQEAQERLQDDIR